MGIVVDALDIPDVLAKTPGLYLVPELRNVKYKYVYIYIYNIDHVEIFKKIWLPYLKFHVFSYNLQWNKLIFENKNRCSIVRDCREFESQLCVRIWGKGSRYKVLMEKM